ncbi:MAG: lactate utilization protein [Desulfobacterales bacterium]|nr:lactate utilization protein [Desulfobacterales bacterium]MDD4073188.1 lactate utilization protein [Desulfobacterales bacterium]MDD4392241.1 lactate utilization protein [Desulfobacterales bacterium]
MDKPIEFYWQTRLGQVKTALENNNFDVFLANNASEARKVLLETIIPEIQPRTVSWGGSMTFTATGIYDAVKQYPGLELIDVYDKTLSREASLERRRQALLVDLFITGTNAVTETGELINLDMIGNRVAALTFGPRHVIVLVGRNKIVADLEDAMNRIKNYTAPINAMRLDMKTPCVKTSSCEDCRSPQRICNTWTITEKSFPKGRTRIVLINEDLGI